MCGIVAAVSTRDIVPVLIEGLRRLEYRGYDSCGVALHAGDRPRRARSTARVADLAEQVRAEGLAGFTGIAHTRWATHGAPLTGNAHPHLSPDDARPRIALVHNGIVENHEALREELVARGYVFRSQTDTEVIVHLVDHLYDGDLLEAVRGAVARLRGAYAIAAFCGDEPHRVASGHRSSSRRIHQRAGRSRPSGGMAIASAMNTMRVRGSVMRAISSALAPASSAMCRSVSTDCSRATARP